MSVGPYETPMLTQEAIDARIKEDRISRIQRAMDRAPELSGLDLFSWVGISVQRERRLLAEAIEPLLAAAEGKDK